jgi:hypothetical protein
MGGILGGHFTPTEAGIIAVAYILFVAIPLLNPGHVRYLPRDMALTGLLYSIPLITIGAASVFGWMMAYPRGPAVVSGWISTTAGGDPFMIMLLLVVLFVVVGDFIDAIPAIIIFMPIITDLTQNADINPVHMGVVIIVTLAFGLITPPYGLALLMASKFVGVRFGKAMVASLPIYIVFFAAIAFSPRSGIEACAVCPSRVTSSQKAPFSATKSCKSLGSAITAAPIPSNSGSSTSASAPRQPVSSSAEQATTRSPRSRSPERAVAAAAASSAATPPFMSQLPRP